MNRVRIIQRTDGRGETRFMVQERIFLFFWVDRFTDTTSLTQAIDLANYVIREARSKWSVLTVLPKDGTESNTK
ncbi:MAG: hypothetical protein EOP06_23160 [Proteobacteria bacterium]|nr:MAG: hypothetical protein EOP06_23160 [Pseudomonadota bacterium]